MFVKPIDAALVMGYRATEAGESFEDSFVVWMATLRRRDQTGDAIVECLQRVFAQMADEHSLSELFRYILDQARCIGYGKVWLPPNVFNETLLAPALKPVIHELGHPVHAVPSTGMVTMIVA